MAAHQAPLSLGFSRQEYWSGLPFLSPMHACMLSCFSHAWLCATLWTAAYWAPLSMGFSRQEHWSGLPFPSPVHESEKGKWSRSVMSDLATHGLQPTRLLHPWDFPGKSTGVGCHRLLHSCSAASCNFGVLAGEEECTSFYAAILDSLLKEVKRKWKSLSCVQFFETSWTVACQAPLSMELSRPKYYSG